MEVRLIDPEDDDGLAEFAAVLVASDKEMWPDLSGFTLSDIRAFARFRGGAGVGNCWRQENRAGRSWVWP